MDARPLSAFLYSYPLALAIALPFCNVLFGRLPSVNDCPHRNRRRPEIMLEILWYLQAGLSATMVRQFEAHVDSWRLTYFKLIGVTSACRALKDRAGVNAHQPIVEAYLVRYAQSSMGQS